MASTYTNSLRLELIASGEAASTWGDKTNVNLTNIASAFGYATQDGFAANADSTTTVADGAADPARAMYFKVTSSATLTATRTLTIAPNTISRVMWIENATTGGQSIQISQGTGANVTIATGKTAVVYLDGAGSGAAVVDAMAGVSSGASDTLAEILASGNATGGTDIAVGTGDDITFADSSKAIFGAGSDLSIYSDGSTGKVDGNVDVTGAVTADGLTVEADSGGGGGSTTPVVAVISDTDGGGSWVSGTIFAATDYKSGDGSGAGSGVRVRTGIAQEASSGSTSSYIVQTAPTTAGTMLDRLKISSGGDISFYEDTGTTAKLFWDASAENLTITGQGNQLLLARSSVDTIQFGTGTVSPITGLFIQNATDSNIMMKIDDSAPTDSFVLNSSGSVGVGTSSPDSRLVVQSPDNTLATDIFKLTSQNGAAGLKFGYQRIEQIGASTPITFNTGGSERMRIDSSGNLLVGKTVNTYDTEGTQFEKGGALELTTDGGRVLRLNRTSNDGNIIEFNRGAGTTVGSIGVVSSDRLYIATGDGLGLQLDKDNNRIIPCDAAGSYNSNVSLGSSALEFNALHLSGTANVGGLYSDSGTGNVAATFKSTDAGAYINIIDSGSGSFGAMIGAISDDIVFAPNNVEAMRISSAGQLFLNLTAEVAAGYIASIKCAAGTGGVIIQNSNTTGVPLSFRNTSGSGIGSVSTTNTATAYNTSSDQRLKENIVDAPSASDDIDAIQVRSFDWKADGSHQKYGMVAQELQTVAPEAVSAPEDPEEMMGVDYSKLVPMMLKEIQSLRARVAQLES